MSTSNTWHVLGAAVLGVIGAASLLIVEHFRQERRRHVLTRDIAQMSRQLSTMRQELDHIHEHRRKKEKKAKRTSNKRISLVSTTTTSTDDFRSAIDFNTSEEEEFYDLSDDDHVKDHGVDKLLKQADEHLDSGNADLVKETLVILRNLLMQDIENPAVQWRIAKGYYQLAMMESDSAKKQEYIHLGIEQCNNSLERTTTDANVHKWYAILVGCRSDFQPMRDKISDGYLFQHHINMALQLNPRDATLHHLLGRFSYEVAGLKWLERKAAAALFGEPPSATYQEALDHFLKAETLSKAEWKENRLSIAKCFIANGDYKDAVKWLWKARDIKNTEKQFDAEIQTLLSKYEHHR